MGILCVDSGASRKREPGRKEKDMADLTFECPECSHALIVDVQAAGLVVPCPDCGTQIRVPVPDPELEAGETDTTAKVDAATPEAPPVGEPVPVPEMAAAAVEYRVVGMIDGNGIAEKVTADAVEFRLNELLQEGWRLRSATTVQTHDAQGNPRQELLLIMERQI